MTGQEYRDLREQKGLTRLQLANLLEVDPSTIQRREALDEVPKENELAILRVTRELPDVEPSEPVAGGGGG